MYILCVFQVSGTIKPFLRISTEFVSYFTDTSQDKIFVTNFNVTLRHQFSLSSFRDESSE